MVTVQNEDFDLGKITDSGQCFRMRRTGENAYALIAHGRVLRLMVDKQGVHFHCPQAEYETLWQPYFDLKTDYAPFRAAVPQEDGFLTAAVRCGQGIRILQQDPWEMLVTFIISQRKNIPAIQRSVEALCAACGDALCADDFGAGGPSANKLCVNSETLYAFPDASRVAALSDEALRGCSLGYRVPYVRAAARMVAEGTLDLQALAAYDDDALSQALLTVPGVGVKVANCVMLFGYHRLAGFPRDVWINRMIDTEYGGVFPLERYTGFEGVIQQYIFYYARSAEYRAAREQP